MSPAAAKFFNQAGLPLSHEQVRHESAAKEASDRLFGAVLVAVFAAIGLVPLASGQAVRPWALIAAGILAAAALLAPSVLSPGKRAWLALGDRLRRVMTPVVLAFIFFVVLTPLGLLMRLLGKDLLRLRWRSDEATYWIDRPPGSPTPSSFKDQF